MNEEEYKVEIDHEALRQQQLMSMYNELASCTDIVLGALKIPIAIENLDIAAANMQNMSYEDMATVTKAIINLGDICGKINAKYNFHKKDKQEKNDEHHDS